MYNLTEDNTILILVLKLYQKRNQKVLFVGREKYKNKGIKKNKLNFHVTQMLIHFIKTIYIHIR